jgi:hypothetical protein
MVKHIAHGDNKKETKREYYVCEWWPHVLATSYM